MKKGLLWNLIASLLILAMFLLQFSPQFEVFKYWICFVVTLGATISIVYNTYMLGSKLIKIEKLYKIMEIDNKNFKKQIESTSKLETLEETISKETEI